MQNSFILSEDLYTNSAVKTTKKGEFKAEKLNPTQNSIEFFPLPKSQELLINEKLGK